MRGAFRSSLLRMGAAAPRHHGGQHGPWKAAFTGKGGGAGIGKKTSPALRRGGGKDHFNLSAAFTPRESRKGGLGHARCTERWGAGS